MFYVRQSNPRLGPSRRNSILIVNCLSVVGATLMVVSKVSESFETLILGRLLFGLFCGLVMSLNPLYIQEVSPTLLRGAFATLNQVAFALGILLGMVRRTPMRRCRRDFDEGFKVPWPRDRCRDWRPCWAPKNFGPS